jgi:hypothetical protein
MHFLSLRRMSPTHMEASFHKIEGCSMRSFVSFVPVH